MHPEGQTGTLSRISCYLEVVGLCQRKSLAPCVQTTARSHMTPEVG